MWSYRAFRWEWWDHTSRLWLAIAEPNRDAKSNPEPFTLKDIHPYYDDFQKSQTAEDIRAEQLARSINKMANMPEAVLNMVLDGVTSDPSRESGN